MVSRLMGMPAGSPVRVATRHSPCDSPAVSNRNISLNFYPTRLPCGAKPGTIHFAPAYPPKEAPRGQVPALLYPADLMLAAGPARADPLSAHLVAFAAVPDRRHRGRRSARVDLGAGDAARADSEGDCVARAIAIGKKPSES